MSERFMVFLLAASRPGPELSTSEEATMTETKDEGMFGYIETMSPGEQPETLGRGRKAHCPHCGAEAGIQIFYSIDTEDEERHAEAAFECTHHSNCADRSVDTSCVIEFDRQHGTVLIATEGNERWFDNPFSIAAEVEINA
jgi:hypothetical protein